MAPSPPTTRHDWLSALGFVLLLFLFAGAVAGEMKSPAADGSLRIEALPNAQGALAELSEDASAVLLPGHASRDTRAVLHLVLPRVDEHSARWVVWMARNPVEALELTRPGWQTPTRSFFNPSSSNRLLPTGFVFALPTSWEGAVDLELHARSDVRSMLQPRLMREDDALRLEGSGVAISALLYASLFTLALLSLALFSAARDHMFLALFGFATISLLSLAAANGHLYQALWFRWFAAWGASGLLALGMLYSASSLQMLMHYSGARALHPQATRAVDVFSLSLVALAALFLIDVPVLSAPLQPVAAIAWLAYSGASLALVIEAARRRIRMSWALIALSLLTSLGSLLVEWSMRGHRMDLGWARFGYQIGLALTALILAVGLISRIGEYRDQRDRERLARADSERRMRREAARSDLNAALQTKLRASSEGDVEWTAFRMLLDHLMPHVPTLSATILTHAYHGHDVLVTLPSSAANAQAVREQLDPRRLALKRIAGNAITMQQPVVRAGAPEKVSIEAVVPLHIRAPAWGVLLLEREGSEGFSTEELALVSECARLALTHIDQALAAINLRRSAELDALTGTFNRRTIDLWVARTFAESERDAQPMSVLFVDMDHFKAINDKHGHACGDHCLRTVAATLRKSLGEADLLGRYGGEEFIAVLPGRGAAVARNLGEHLRGDVERLEIEWEGQILRLTVSVGVATRLDGERRATETVDRADKALYAAKRSGRNCVQVAPAVFS